ncbi:MAG: hypothetical protein K5744_09575 [Eubacterium sp.]|jgi:hypothetical protein|nr:hypothetical protein [Eubacterium sp.]
MNIVQSAIAQVQSSPQLLAFGAVIGLIVALLLCFSGYKYAQLWMMVVCFLIGAAFGFLIGAKFLPSPGYAKYMIGLACGGLCAAISYKVYKVGLFIFAGSAAASVISLFTFPVGDGWEALRALVYVGVFVLAGMLALKYAREYLIVLTGAVGGIQAGSNIQKLIPMYVDLDSAVLLMIVLAAAGIAFQFLTTKKS